MRFTLPEDTDVVQVNAEFKDGALKIHLAKTEKVKPKAIEVQIGGGSGLRPFGEFSRNEMRRFFHKPSPREIDMRRRPQYVDLSVLIQEEHLDRSWAVPRSRFWWVVVGLALMVVFLLGVDLYA